MVRNLGELGLELQKIMRRLLANQRLLKLLYYTDPDPFNHADLTEAQIDDEVFERLVKIIPRVGPKETAQSIVAIRVVSGAPNMENDEFQDLEFNIEVFCPLTQWIIKDDNLRPFCILGEIQKSLNGKVINGMGKLVGGGFHLNFLTDEISCYEAVYSVINYD